MEILNLISNSGFIVVNKYLLKLLGLNATILLGELASEYDYWNTRGETEEGFFYTTVENVENNTTLTKYQQSQALTKLLEYNLVEVQIKGIPAKRYIRLNEEEILNMFDCKKLKNLTASSQKTLPQEVKKLDGNNNKEIIIKNNNKEVNKEKHKYGTYQHVFLTDEQYEKLKQDYPNEYETMIQELDEGLELHNYSYKNHYLAILKWHKKSQAQAKNNTPYRKQGFNEDYVNERNRRMLERYAKLEQEEKEKKVDVNAQAKMRDITKNLF